MPGMPGEQSLRLSLEIALEGEAMRGAIVDARGRRTAFGSWLGLIATVDQARARANENGHFQEGRGNEHGT
jgi:hypothetical protein